MRRLVRSESRQVGVCVVVSTGSGLAAEAGDLAPADSGKAAEADEKAWIKESFELAEKSVYAGPVGDGKGPFTLTENYQKQSLDIAKKQIALAGARLANLLNQALK